jgi:hypothetical protein
VTLWGWSRRIWGGVTDAQLVDVLWGCARLQLYDAAVLDATAEEVRVGAGGDRARGACLAGNGGTDGQLVDVLWGCARLQLYDTAVLDATAEEVRGW